MKLKVLERIQIGFDELFSLCESPIEKQFLEAFINNISSGLFFDFNELGDPAMRFVSQPVKAMESVNRPQLIDDFITGEAYSIIGLQYNMIEKSNPLIGEFTKVDSQVEKVDQNTWKAWADKTKTNYNEKENVQSSINLLKIFPQYSVGNYRLDFAVICDRYFNNEWVETKKYNIECGGHDFHSTKVQIKNDNERSRYLLLLGWQTIRFSGSEIYSKTEMNKFIYRLLNLLLVQ